MLMRVAVLITVGVVAVAGVAVYLVAQQGGDPGSVIGLAGVALAGVAWVSSIVERTATYRGGLFAAQLQANHDILGSLWKMDQATKEAIRKREAKGEAQQGEAQQGEALGYQEDVVKALNDFHDVQQAWVFLVPTATLTALNKYIAAHAAILFGEWQGVAADVRADPNKALSDAYAALITAMRAESGTDPLGRATLGLIGGGLEAAQRRDERRRMALARLDLQADVYRERLEGRRRPGGPGDDRASGGPIDRTD